MEFEITCPVDGPVTVSLEDIDTVVIRESERADITFVCPHCGTEITVAAMVPSFLLSAIEALAEETDGIPAPFAGMVHIASEDDARLPCRSGRTTAASRTPTASTSAGSSRESRVSRTRSPRWTPRARSRRPRRCPACSAHGIC